MKTLAIAAALLILRSGFAQVLYNINFQTADQGINQIVRTGAPPQYVSSVIFGTPRVVSAFGPLNQQPLLFNSNGQSPIGEGYYYTQIGLNLGGAHFQNLDLTFDFTDTGSGHDFIVLFDTPSVRNFHFTGGNISFENPSSPSVNIGSYALGRAYNFDVHVDFLANQWSFYENGRFLANGAFDPSGLMQSIRFNYSADGPDISGTAIDNVFVTVPEPRGLTTIAAAVFAAACFCRHRKTVQTNL